ncbi:histidine kinase [Microtetraspora sp. NBRC 13810]|uniref:sensor histidine kinase n=1 Tax=Microtetraspora sp. NBRC 13810 TaxID=3030990 RepID=UPI0024A52F34|nr:sensor histidine kinase [Microtetraspora sp. NBRC 13810]GLW10669.1 histidine kinase [Microtetraspora sp. NBRC 13810]
MTEAELTTPWDRVRAHYSAATWLRTFHAVAGVPVALFCGAVIAALVALTVLFFWTVVVALAGLWALLWVVPRLSRVQRARFAALLGEDIPEAPVRPVGGRPVRWFLTEVRTLSTWRQLGYHLLALPLAGISALLVGGAWVGALIMPAVALRGWLSEDVVQAVICVLVMVALCAFAPWLARAAAVVDTLAARALLGPSEKERLERRVAALRESRADAVDAADTERRRIERDLHDGTQQRLVSLAMNLGMARATLTELPEPARQAIEQAHEEAKLALRELRDFVRGLHPAVLNDQGLDAALSGLAARAPFPVRLHVDVAERASPTIEAVAFFVVSETLTNVAKHANALSAEVDVRRDGDRLLLAVRDDGLGGADPALGSGLRGLAQRVGSVDGSLRIDSPLGGPTTIDVELPCA